jgi:hypothetical protein
LVLDSGELSFQAILIHCKSSAAHDVTMWTAGVSGQFPIAAVSYPGILFDL